MLRVRTTIVGGAGGSKLNTAYWQTASEDATSAQVIVNSMIAFWTAIRDEITSAMSLTISGLVAQINPVDGALQNEFSVTGASVNGSNAGDQLPNQCQGGIGLITSTFADGRRIRGHWNVPGPCETESLSGVPNAAYKLDLNNAVAALVGPGGAATQIVVWRRPRLLPTPRAGQAAPVTSAVTRDIWFTLNSRRS